MKLQVTVPMFPDWVNAKWFNTLMVLLVLAGLVMEAGGWAWTPTWVNIISAVVGFFGLTVKPQSAQS